MTKQTEAIQLDGEVEDDEGKGSPTELAESEGEEDEDKQKKTRAMDTDIKKEKRKRESRRRKCCGDKGGGDGLAVPVGDEDDDSELDSPSKRPQRGDSAPLSGQEIRDLLFGHVKAMKDAWRSFQGRLDQVETTQVQQNHEMINIRTRTAALEKQGVTFQKSLDSTAKNVDDLAEDVKNMKVQLGDLQARPLPGPDCRAPAGAPSSSGPPALDPWADFLKKKGRGEVDRNGPSSSSDAAAAKPGETLTEDEKRTLVFGGWARDTRKAIIEQESEAFLKTEGMKALIDVEQLAVYGPRRSVGMMKIVQREGEMFTDMKNRMWEVVRLVSATNKVELPSTKEFGAVKTLWASFVKTKSARLRSSLVSQVRRITCELALDAKNAEGGIKNLPNTQPSAYDCDWNMGTIWCGALKLASSTHKAPREGECVTMPGGWVCLDAVAKTAGCSIEEAKMALEREL